jgi:hypothetical protein
MVAPPQRESHIRNENLVTKVGSIKDLYLILVDDISFSPTPQFYPPERGSNATVCLVNNLYQYLYVQIIRWALEDGALQICANRPRIYQSLYFTFTYFTASSDFK